MRSGLRHQQFKRFHAKGLVFFLLTTPLIATNAFCRTSDLPASASSFNQTSSWFLGIIVVTFASLVLIIVLLLINTRKHLHAKAQLVESENRFRSLSDDALVGIYIIQDSFFRYVNPKMAETFGYDVEELVDKIPPRQLVLAEDWPMVRDNLQKRLTNEARSIHYEFRGVRKDQEVIFIEVFGSRTIIQGRPAVIGTSLDITDRKRSEEELRALNAELERRVAEEVEKNLQKDRMLFHNARLAAMGELLSNIAHQWRQPLNSIGLLIQGILMECEQGQPTLQSVTECVNKAMEKIGYLSKIINEFQSFFTPESEREVFDPSAMVDKAAALVASSFEQSGITLRVVNEGMVPMSGYALEFSQVILNILNNAKDVLIERGREEPAVIIECHCKDGINVVKILDNAGGIPQSIVDKIFDPYFTTKFKSQGTGLGLYMSKMIIENIMGGKLYVQNTSEGAEFSIELPVFGTSSTVSTSLR